MSDRAEITLFEKSVKPSGRLSGSVKWSGSARPGSLEMRLFWMTRGRGTEELKLIETLPVRLDHGGRADFAFELPDAPWSFAGQLVGVSWWVELVNDQGDGCGTEEFIMSPDGAVRELGKIDRPLSKPKGFGFRSQ